MKKTRLVLFLSVISAITLLVFNINTESTKLQLAEPDNDNLQTSLYFEQNMGQMNQEVHYVLKGTNHSVFLKENELLFTVKNSEKLLKNLNIAEEFNGYSFHLANNHWFTMQFPGANNKGKIEGVNLLESKSNYLKGNDPDKWITNIQHYDKVAHRELYNGIDLICYGKDKYLEYDFVVASGANPDQIAIKFKGVDDISIDEAGNLNLVTGNETTYHRRPLAYQQIEESKIIVESEYRLEENGLVGFELGDYNKEYELVIDPIISYSTFIGDLANDQGHDIVTDHKGNVYISGMTGLDFPITPGAYDEILGPDEQNEFDLYPSPNALDYTFNSGEYTVLATSNFIDPGFGAPVTFTSNPPYPFDDDYADIALPFQFPFQDQFYSNIYVNSDGNITFGQPQPNSNRMRHDMIFGPPRVAAFYADLAPIVFGYGNVHADVRVDRVVVTWLDVPAFSGDYSSQSSPLTFQIILHANGDIQIIYDFIEPGFGAVVGISAGNNPEDPQEIDLSAANGGEEGGTLFEVFNYGAYVFPDAFIMKFNKKNELVWSTYIGGDFVDAAQSIALDKKGNIIALLNTFSSDLPVFGSMGRHYSGGYFQFDGYATKLSKHGDELLFGTYLGGSGQDLSANVVVDKKNDLYFSGVTSSTDFLDGESTEYDGAYSNQGGVQPYIVKLDNSGKLITYTHFPANGLIRYAYQRSTVKVTSNGNVILAGNDNSGNVPTSLGASQPTHGGGYDVFVAKLSSDLKSLKAATYLGGSGDEIDSEFTLDESGNIYVTAMTTSLDFPVTNNAFDKTYNGGDHDGFWSKIDKDLKKLKISTYYGGSLSDEPATIVVHPSGEVFVAGLTHSEDFPLTKDYLDNTVVAGEAFLMRFSKNGEHLKFSTLFGGDGEDIPFRMNIKPDGNRKIADDADKKEDNKQITLNVTGLTKSPDFPVTPDAFDTTYGNLDGWNDVIFMKFVFGKDDPKHGLYTSSNNSETDNSSKPGPGTSSKIITEDNSHLIFQDKLKKEKDAYYSNTHLEDLKTLKEKELLNNAFAESTLLKQNYPNPFSKETHIEFNLQYTSKVLVSIIGLDGKEVLRLADREFNQGSHKLVWTGSDATGSRVPDGIYLLHFKTSDHSVVKRMMLLK